MWDTQQLKLSGEYAAIKVGLILNCASYRHYLSKFRDHCHYTGKYSEAAYGIVT